MKLLRTRNRISKSSRFDSMLLTLLQVLLPTQQQLMAARFPIPPPTHASQAPLQLSLPEISLEPVSPPPPAPVSPATEPSLSPTSTSESFGHLLQPAEPMQAPIGIAHSKFHLSFI